MYRNALIDLIDWKNQKNRKPLVLPGARQVGKTWLVGEFARRNFDRLVEINFDQTPEQADLFIKGNVDRCLQLLETEYNLDIIPGKDSSGSATEKERPGDCVDTCQRYRMGISRSTG